MRDFWNEEKEKKKINKKKIIILSIITLIIIAIITIGIIYSRNEEFRNWMDKNILRKEIYQENLATIEIKEDENPTVYAFNQYIGVLNKNEFKIYNNTGKEEETLNLKITTPVIDSANRYLAVGESKGKKLYLIEDKKILWEKDIEGNISQIKVNQNGYVAISVVDTIHKTVVIMYDPQGNELFYTFFSSTRVGDMSISKDNKYLAIAEIDTSGTIIKSNISIISVDTAKKDAENSVIHKYEGENNDLITKLNYQDKNRLLCMYTDKVKLITEDGNEETITENKDKKITFSDVNLSNSIITIEEKSSGLFTADSVANIINTDNKNTSTYTANSVTKEIYTNTNIIGLNLGTEIEFINTNGWLVKRYIGKQEITQVTLSNSIAGIVYRDRVEIINL